VADEDHEGELGAPAPSTRDLGQRGERRAAAWLEQHGLAILDGNVTLAGAEIDLIARDPAEPELGEPWTCVFVEVRGRSDDRLGHPLETIDARKQARVRRAATAWLVGRDLWERVAVRFDVIALVGDDDPLWLRDAF
jgi:putative endonuclease